jgi:hypothetical protein
LLFYFFTLSIYPSFHLNFFFIILIHISLLLLIFPPLKRWSQTFYLNKFFIKIQLNQKSIQRKKIEMNFNELLIQQTRNKKH